MEIQDLSKAEEMAKEAFRKNPKRSLSAIFRGLRKDNRFSFFGDIPLAFSVIYGAAPVAIKPSRSQIHHLLKGTEDYKNSTKSGKTKLIRIFDGIVEKSINCCFETGFKSTETGVSHQRRWVYRLER